MNALRILALPALLVAGIAVYVALNPGGTIVANPDATPPARPTAAPEPAADLPDGVSGALTYRTGRELVTVQLPDLTEVARYIPAPEPMVETSADGTWLTDWGCDDRGCTLTLRQGGATVAEHTYESITYAEWSPSRERFAAMARTFDGLNQLVLAKGSDLPSTRVIHESTTSAVTAFAWIDDTTLLLAQDASGSHTLATINIDGKLTPVGAVPGTVSWLYPSPDRARFLFTQTYADGWRLFEVDAAMFAISDLGNMGSDAPGSATPPDVTPPAAKAGPMYVAWSPDGTKVAFGGGFEPPYIMSVVDLQSGEHIVTEFPNGYPGEIAWSPDGSKIGVSTYDIERTHHETWVVDPDTGAGRHLMNGCVIVWSPDGRFLAVHGEDKPGIAIVDVETGARGQLTHRRDDAPIRWEP